MKENYKVPLKYKEGTYKADEIVNFSGEVIDIEYIGCDMFRYIVPKYDREVHMYEVSGNYDFMATYDSDGVIKHIELKREKRTELVYINFKDNEHAKENIWQYSCFWGDRISKEILERQEKIARIFIGYFYDGEAAWQCVDAYTTEEVQKVLDKYNNDNNSADNCYNYSHDEEILPDNDTFRIMLLCTDEDYVNEMFEFAVYSMAERIKNNVLEKVDVSEDFKVILKEHDGDSYILE